MRVKCVKIIFTAPLITVSITLSSGVAWHRGEYALRGHFEEGRCRQNGASAGDVRKRVHGLSSISLCQLLLHHYRGRRIQDGNKT